MKYFYALEFLRKLFCRTLIIRKVIAHWQRTSPGPHLGDGKRQGDLAGKVRISKPAHDLGTQVQIVFSKLAEQ